MNRIGQSQYWITALRLITASVWLNAGIFGKLLNPGFLNPNSNDYVGLTIQYLSQGSVIRNFLYAVAFPHPILTGELVMTGEIIFGILLFLGLFTKLASTTAFYTNLIYFLAAAWTGAEEYGLNLLMMGVELYLIYYGASYFSIDSLIMKNKISNNKIWITIGTIIYASVVLYLYLVGK